MKKHLITLSCFMLSLAVNASEKGHDHSSHGSSHGEDKKPNKHSAHEHGIATMNIARVGDEVQIELSTPAYNIVGFEHKPKSADQEAAVSKAEKSLKDPLALFSFSGATCAVEHVSVESPFEHHDDEHGHKEKQKSDSKHKHESHDHKAHDNKAQEEEDSHSEYVLEYHFECDNFSTALEIKAVSLFAAYPNFSEIRVQWLSNKKQGSAELSNSNSGFTIN